ncbi:MAG: hypothetical protein MZV64_42670 [Ignavibacteriales bacterium]|nr:hypothetical protein [Ignavibacteriales bacterium]
MAGFPAVTSTFRVQTEQGYLRGLVAWIDYRERVFQILGYTPEARWNQYSNVFGASIASFGRETDSDGAERAAAPVEDRRPEPDGDARDVAARLPVHREPPDRGPDQPPPEVRRRSAAGDQFKRVRRGAGAVVFRARFEPSGQAFHRGRAVKTFTRLAGALVSCSLLVASLTLAVPAAAQVAQPAAAQLTAAGVQRLQEAVYDANTRNRAAAQPRRGTGEGPAGAARRPARRGHLPQGQAAEGRRVAGRLRHAARPDRRHPHRSPQR